VPQTIHIKGRVEFLKCSVFIVISLVQDPTTTIWPFHTWRTCQSRSTNYWNTLL